MIHISVYKEVNFPNSYLLWHHSNHILKTLKIWFIYCFEEKVNVQHFNVTQENTHFNGRAKVKSHKIEGDPPGTHTIKPPKPKSCKPLKNWCESKEKDFSVFEKVKSKQNADSFYSFFALTQTFLWSHFG